MGSEAERYEPVTAAVGNQPFVIPKRMPTTGGHKPLDFNAITNDCRRLLAQPIGMGKPVALHSDIILTRLVSRIVVVFLGYGYLGTKNVIKMQREVFGIGHIKP